MRETEMQMWRMWMNHLQLQEREGVNDTDELEV